MNETLRAYVEAYTSPVKLYHFSISDAMAAWGVTIEPEDLLMSEAVK